jgi:hypothetical protein
MGPPDGAALADHHAAPDRAPADLDRENATAVMEQPNVRHHADYLAVEEPILGVTFMAGIARDLAYELLDVETPKKDDEDIVIRMTKRAYQQFFFAIEDVHDRALAIEKNYHAK